MPPLIVLEIIKLSLELALQIVKDMPPEEKAKAWARHAQWMEFWEGLIPPVKP